MPCNQLRNYHGVNDACRLFDDAVANMAGAANRRTFFSYYRVPGRKPDPELYLYGPVEARRLQRFAVLQILLRFPHDIPIIPPEYASWSTTFSTEYIFDISNPQRRGLMLDAIESCIDRRILFRNVCIRTCNKRIDTSSHDEFLLMLQILRARIIVYTV
jgi:hypothetical protein